MTKTELKEAIINFIKSSEHNIAYFTTNPSASGIKEVVSFHEKEDNEIGGVLPEMLTLNTPDTIVLAELVQGLTPVRRRNGAYTYSVSELGL
jgi:hypothetical protein